MTAREFAVSNLRGCDGLGVEGYTVRRTLEVEKARVAAMRPYKKETFVDIAIKERKWVPDAKYNVIPDLKSKNTKSEWAKDRRHSLYTDACDRKKRSPCPDPGSYMPAFTLTEKRKIGCYSLKGKLGDTSFLAEAAYKGTTSGQSYHPKFHLTESRMRGIEYKKPINAKLDSTP